MSVIGDSQQEILSISIPSINVTAMGYSLLQLEPIYLNYTQSHLNSDQMISLMNLFPEINASNSPNAIPPNQTNQLRRMMELFNTMNQKQ